MDHPSAHHPESMDPLSGRNEPAPVDDDDQASMYPCRRRVRFRWTPELRNQFDEAVNALGGPEQASIEEILSLMNNVDTIITREMVGGKLQKCRIRAQGRRRSRVRNLQENSTNTAWPLEELRRGYSLVNPLTYSLVNYPLNRLHNSNDASSYTSLGNYTINTGGANEVDLTFVFYVD